MELRDATALVTGGSSGIGQAVAEHLAAAGARVIVHGRDDSRTHDTARRIGGTACLGDLGTSAGVHALTEQVLAEGGADILVANAGFGWSGPLTQMPGTLIDEMVRVDLLAPVQLVRALVPAMVQRGHGHVVLISSVAGRAGVAGEAAYAACKAGLDAFAESLRLELTGTGVGISVVVPAAVRTPFFDRRGRGYDRSIPRPVDPGVVARAVVRAVRENRDEVWVPRWLRVVQVVRAIAPRTYRRLAARLGEPVRSSAP